MYMELSLSCFRIERWVTYFDAIAEMEAEVSTSSTAR
jgi:hypothetical protein